jgi:hypothetical protein
VLGVAGGASRWGDWRGKIAREHAAMASAVKAIYEHGVFRPKEPVELEEQTEVEVLIPGRPRFDPDDPTGWKAIDKLIGLGKAVMPDVSEKHDDFLYGDPDD